MSKCHIVGNLMSRVKSTLDAMDELDLSLKGRYSKPIIKHERFFVGDFNYGDIKRDNGLCQPGSRDNTHCNKF